MSNLRADVIALRHLASEGALIYSNPLFLTLLCRYVRQYSASPVNDHDLLESHVIQLSNRDQDYIQRKYGLKPEELLDGATRLAALFAENTALSLAPTLDEIRRAVPWNSDLRSKIENLVGTLVEVKIGRSDVREARVGDRRFTFSHRHYQETLFVRHLTQHPDQIPLRALLTDIRWREYAVTLLQSQPRAAILPLLDEATSILRERAEGQEPTEILEEYGGELSYYSWKDETALPLLQLLQDGLSRRLEDIPPELAAAAEAFLGPRWSQGDPYDRVMVLEVGALLPQDSLREHISCVVSKGADSHLQRAAFRQVTALQDISQEMADWIRRRVSTAVIMARHRMDLFRLEALAARLPDSVGSSYVMQRCCSLRALARFPFFLFVPTSRIVHQLSAPGTNKLGSLLTMVRGELLTMVRGERSESYNLLIVLFVFMFYYLLACLVCVQACVSVLFFHDIRTTQTRPSHWSAAVFLFIGVLGVVGTIHAIRLFVRLVLRDVGRPVNLSFVKAALGSGGAFRKAWLVATRLYPIGLAAVGAAVVPLATTHLVAYRSGYKHVTIFVDLLASTLFVYCLTGFFVVRRIRKKRRQERDYKTVCLGGGAVRPLALRARSLDELRTWLLYDEAGILPNIEHIRSLGRLLICPMERCPLSVRETPLLRSHREVDSRVQVSQIPRRFASGPAGEIPPGESIVERCWRPGSPAEVSLTLFG